MEHQPIEPQFKSFLELCAHMENHPEDFLSWIEFNYPELTQKVRENKIEPAKANSLEGLKDLFIVRADDLYGRALVTKDLERDSKKTAMAITIADGWHGIMTFPLFLFVTRDFLIIGPIFAVAIAVVLNRLSNYCGAIAAANQPEKRSWSKVGLLGMILMNTILGLLAGPGTELMMNKAALNTLKAQELIKEKILPIYQTKITRAKETVELGKQLQEQCDLKMNEFTNLKKAGSPRASSLYREIQGQWDKDESYWSSVDQQQLPLCKKAALMSAQGIDELQKSEKELDEQTKASQKGELLFLQKQYSDIYTDNFNQDQSIKSGEQEVKLAIQSFSNKMIKGEWDSLGFTLFSFAISLITSLVAILFTITHSHRQDVADSFDPEIIKAREKFFDSVRKGIEKKATIPEPTETFIEEYLNH
jgi:hypothetical protein